jgi:glucose/arabinose dehydrogenase
MRRSLLVVALLLAACTSADDVSPSSTVTTGPPAPSTTAAPTPSTTASGATTTTVAPTTTTPLPELQGLVYEVVAGIEFPIQIVPRNEDASLLATKGGMIFDFDPAGTMGAPILDISERVRSQGEQGLLSIAVDPEDDTRLFIHYSAEDGDTVVE